MDKQTDRLGGWKDRQADTQTYVDGQTNRQIWMDGTRRGRHTEMDGQTNI